MRPLRSLPSWNARSSFHFAPSFSNMIAVFCCLGAFFCRVVTSEEVFSGRIKIPSNKWGLSRWHTLKERIHLAAVTHRLSSGWETVQRPSLRPAHILLTHQVLWRSVNSSPARQRAKGGWWEPAAAAADAGESARPVGWRAS